jgi:hypothetical protein
MNIENLQEIKEELNNVVDFTASLVTPWDH